MDDVSGPHSAFSTSIRPNFDFYPNPDDDRVNPAPDHVLIKHAQTTISGMYILRGLMLPSDLVKFVQRTRPFRFVLLSIGSLATGLLYLSGTLAG